MAAAKGTTIRFLKRQLESKMVKSESGRYFLPEAYLNVIFTLEDIEKAVDELDCPAHHRLGLAKRIYEGGRRIFAILIKNGEENSIVAFREHDVLDARLPLNEALATWVLDQVGPAFAREYQWQFLPYKFLRHMRDYHRDMSDGEWILPFVGDHKVVASGGFGDVSQVNVFPSQQDFTRNKNDSTQVIRKTLRIKSNQSTESYNRAFRNEQRCLVLLNQLNHPNIVPLLASYTYMGVHHFLFPTYEMDLEALFKRSDRFGDFRWTFTFYSALRGLAAALRSTHQLHLVKRKHGLDLDAIGYHHDLRPVNILVDQHTFVLADFGLGKIKSEDSPSQTQWKVGNGDYLAPECMGENFAHQEVGRAIDVWAFACLVIEVVTYIKRGAAGLEEFRALRMSQSRHSRWEESCFYDEDGHVKTAVQEWLTLLTVDDSLETPTALLIDLSGQALRKEPKDRISITDICEELSFISLKSHYLAVHQIFNRSLERSADPRDGRSVPGMKLWFERERFVAFGRVLGLDSVRVAPTQSDDLSTNYDRAQMTMVTLHRRLEDELDRTDSIEEDRAHLIKVFENDICKLVDSLWNLLSPAEERKAEHAWLQRVTDTKNINHLHNLGRTFGSLDGPMYEKGAAIAMMKKVRLQILSNPTSLPPEFIISAKDVEVLRRVDGHDMGLFQKKEHVLIEWMYYTPAWKDVSPEQRSIVMGLKAQSFGIDSKPSGLRTLDCIGTFEQTGERSGYGFVYRLPVVERHANPGTSATTLHQLVTLSYRNPRQYRHRPVLGDKFRLVSMLAGFLREFHSIGWLHENFNSHNILIFNTESNDDDDDDNGSHLPSRTLQQLSVIGLHKSRPGGEAWHTQGPTAAAGSQDYQHPEYVSSTTNRFRLKYDYHSFGLVLLEIGFWRPLWAWSGQERCQRMNLAAFRQELVEKYVPRLGAEMGLVFQHAVRYCLDPPEVAVQKKEEEEEEEEEGKDDGAVYSGDPDGIAFQRFMENVIEPLEGLTSGVI
ncbi:MAG: hypothetical protein Q9186_005572 [Xanthomendoza sp. 1 TL-2023]